MVKKRYGLGILAITLVFGMTLIGCSNPTGGETWSDIKSIDQMHGTWVGSYKQTMTIEDFYKEFTNDDWDSDLQNEFGNMKVTINVLMTMNIDKNENEMSGTVEMKMTFSGGNIKTVWEELSDGISSEYNNEESEVKIILDSGNYSITIIAVTPKGKIENPEALLKGLKINETETKILVPADLDEGTPEMIMFKQ